MFLESGFHNYSAVEPNTRMRTELTRAGIRTKSYLAPPLDEPDGTFDWVILDNVFEHLNNSEEASELATEVDRVLKRSGYWCIASPDILHWGNDFYNCDYTHSNVTSVRRTIQIFHNSGFRPVRFSYLSGFLSGLPATLASYGARTALMLADSNGIDRKLYKLKLSFLRRFLIIGQKQDEAG